MFRDQFDPGLLILEPKYILWKYMKIYIMSNHVMEQEAHRHVPISGQLPVGFWNTAEWGLRLGIQEKWESLPPQKCECFFWADSWGCKPHKIIFGRKESKFVQSVCTSFVYMCSVFWRLWKTLTLIVIWPCFHGRARCVHSNVLVWTCIIALII